MSAVTEDEIKRAATTAKDLLGQLGPLVWALHEGHVSTVPRAILLSVDPDAYVRIGVCDPGDTIRKGVVANLESLRRGVSFEEAPRLFKSRGIRDVINRSIVVYAVAVLEQFLDEAGEQIWTQRGGQSQKCAQCRRKVGWPASALTMISTLAGAPSCIDLRLLDHYVNTGWLALVRNAIIHSDGKAERADNDACQYKLLDAKGHAPWRPDKWCDQDGRCQPILVWDGKCPAKPSDDWKNRSFSIAIDEFIVPRLRDAQAFVGEAEQTFLNSLKKS